MQALESLNDSQVNDFLSGKTPLNLSMRLGDHMMLIQLQLSTVNPANGNGSTNNSHNANGTNCSSSRAARANSQRTARSGSVSSNSSNSSGQQHTHHHHHHHHHHRQQQQASNTAGGSTLSASSSTSSLLTTGGSTTSINSNNSSTSRISIGSTTSPSTSTTSLGSTQSGTSTKTPSLIKSSDISSYISKRDYESLQNIVRSIAMSSQPSRLAVSANQNNNQTSLRTAPTKLCHINNNNNNNTANEAPILEQSPIKSLSNLVTSSTVDIKNIPNSNNDVNATAAAAATTATATTTIPHSNGLQTVTPIINCQDPIAAKLTSCLCTRLNIKNCAPETCGLRRQDITMVNGVPAQQRTTSLAAATNGVTMHGNKINSTTNVTNNTPSATALLHKTANNPIVRSKHRHHHHHHHHHHYHAQNGAGGGIVNPSSSTSTTATVPTTSNPTEIVRQKLLNIARSFPTSTTNVPTTNASSVSNDSGFASDDSMLGNGSSTATAKTTTTTTSTNSSSIVANNSSRNAHVMDIDDSGVIVTDTRTLAEASRNLTQTLRKLSKEVFTNKIDLANRDEGLRKNGSGAVFDSMKNHGKGIYSGTFSGTLNPALQDRYGRPKRDISTVIHILNDLLSVTPQYSRGARFSIETPTSSSVSSAATNNGLNSSHSKQLPSKHHGHLHNQNCLKCVKAHTLSQQANSSSSSNNSNSNNSSNSNNVNCAYGECNGHYPTNASSNSKSVTSRNAQYACCTNNTNGGNHHHSHHHHHHNHNHAVDSNNERNTCSCRYRTVGDGETTGEREREHTCQKCLSEMENLRTKSKLDQLRLVMQQRKQKREARKLNSAPYEARVVTAASSSSTSTNVVVVGSGSGTEINETTTSTTRIVAAGSTATKSTLNNTNNNNNNNNINNISNNNSNNSNNNNNSSISNSSNTLTTASSSEVSPNHIVEEVDTAA